MLSLIEMTIKQFLSNDRAFIRKIVKLSIAFVVFVLSVNPVSVLLPLYFIHVLLESLDERKT